MCSTLVAAVALTACSGDVTAPLLEPNVVRENEVSAPTYEMRVVVSTKGTIVALETVRIRSRRAGFVSESGAYLGRRLDKAPAALAGLVDSLQKSRSGVEVAFYETSDPAAVRAKRLASRPRKTSSLRASFSTTEDYPTGWTPSGGYPSSWHPSTDSLSTADEESFLDASIRQISVVAEDYIFMYPDPDIPQHLRMPAADFPRTIAESWTSEFGTAPSSQIGYTAAAGDCGTKRALWGIAAAGVVAATAFTVAAVTAAAAPVATVIGGITIMVAPTTATVAAVHAAAIVSTASAGSLLGWAFGEVWNCKKDDEG